MVKGCAKLEHDIFASHPAPSRVASLTKSIVKHPEVLDQDAGIFNPLGEIELFNFSSKGLVLLGPSYTYIVSDGSTSKTYPALVANTATTLDPVASGQKVIDSFSLAE